MWSVSQLCTVQLCASPLIMYELKWQFAVCYLNKTKITQLKSDIKLDYFHPDIWVQQHEKQHKRSAFWEENDAESQKLSIWRHRSNIASSVVTAPRHWNLFVFCFGHHLFFHFVLIPCLQACIHRISYTWFHLMNKPCFHVLNRVLWGVFSLVLFFCCCCCYCCWQNRASAHTAALAAAIGGGDPSVFEETLPNVHQSVKGMAPAPKLVLT